MASPTPKGSPSASSPGSPPKQQETFLTKAVSFLTQTVANILFMLASALVIHQYNSNPSSLATNPKFTIMDHSFTLPSPIAQPSKINFAVACVVFMAALSSFPNPPNGDYYQPYFLAAGALAAHICTTQFGWDDGYTVVLKSFLPLAVTGALVLSLIFHAVLRLLQKPTLDEAAKGKITEKAS